MEQLAEPPVHFEKPYPERLPGAYTGGFGEQTCRNCHFDYDLNPDGGELSVSGLRDEINKGEIVNVTVKLNRKELGAAGFQLAMRYPDGTQAGTFMSTEDSRVLQSKSKGVEYIQHSPESTRLPENEEALWDIVWKAPNTGDSVVVNIAANASNGDQSEFGDYIYTEEFTVKLK